MILGGGAAWIPA